MLFFEYLEKFDSSFVHFIILRKVHGFIKFTNYNKFYTCMQLIYILIYSKTVYLKSNTSINIIYGKFMTVFMSLYAGHIPTSYLQKSILAVGSAVAALSNPYRHDMVAVCGETTGMAALRYMRKRMQQDPVGQEILETRPRINSSIVDLDHLRSLPDDTLGNHYVSMLDRFKITPDSRMHVKFVDDEDLAYVMQRYREVHDFNHLLLGQPTNVLGEVVIKWFEAIQTQLPMCYLAALFGPAKLTDKQRKILVQKKLPWVAKTAGSAKFFMNYYFEDKFEEKIETVREELNIVIQTKNLK